MNPRDLGTASAIGKPVGAALLKKLADFLNKPISYSRIAAQAFVYDGCLSLLSEGSELL